MSSDYWYEVMFGILIGTILGIVILYQVIKSAVYKALKQRDAEKAYRDQEWQRFRSINLVDLLENELVAWKKKLQP